MACGDNRGHLSFSLVKNKIRGRRLPTPEFKAEFSSGRQPGLGTEIAKLGLGISNFAEAELSGLNLVVASATGIGLEGSLSQP